MNFHIIKKRVKLPATLRALRHRNYKLFISGNIISQIGFWMQSTAQGWLVFPILTKDSSLLGLVGFAGQVPVLALGLFAGAVADSFNRHRLIIFMQIALMLQALLIALLTFLRAPDGGPLITYFHVLLLATVAGAFQAFDIPARQAFLHQMVPKEDLQNAIALNSLAFNTARIVGPSIAGLLIARLARIRPDYPGFGEVICFVINALSFLAVIISLLRMKVTPQTTTAFKGSTAGFLAEGLRYVKREVHIRDLMCFAGAMALFGIPYVMLIQVFAANALQGDAQTFGQLMTSVGVGATCGGIMLAGRSRVKGLARIIVLATTGFALSTLCFAWVYAMWAAILLIGLAGFFMVVTMISSMTLIQHLIADHVRGRVMSIYNMVTTGLMPFGFLVGGALAKEVGVRWAITTNSLLCLVAATVFYFRLPLLRKRAAEARVAGGE